MGASTTFRGYRPRRPAAPRPATAKLPKPLRAALLYEAADLMGLRHINRGHTLVGECRPTAKGLAVHRVLHICKTQARYYGQCDLMLQSPAVEGRKELLTGLRAVPVPQDAAHCVSALYVADYRPNEGAGKQGPPAPAAVVLEGQPTSERPGWLLVLVAGENYHRKSRPANEATAAAAVRAVLPMLPQWLESLTSVNV